MRSHLPIAALLVVLGFSSSALAQPARPKKKEPTAPTTAPAAGATPAAAPDTGPPSPPPPWSGTTSPTSTAGTQLMPASPDAAPAPISAPQTSAPVDANADTTRENRFRMLEARVAADEAVDRANAEKLSWLRGFKLGGFVQAQFVYQGFNAAASPNAGASGLPAGIQANDVVAKADGTTTNPDYFRIRRARLKAEYMPTDYARFVFEIDPAPLGGPAAGVGTIARNVEAIGISRFTPDVIVEYGAGIFKVPFGYEVQQSDADRPFIERSWGEQNLVPSEYDTGARAYGNFFKKGTVQFAVINGVTIGEKTFAILPDLNKGKDVVGRLAYNFGPFDVGASGYLGQGQVVDPVAIRFKQFRRNAVNVEAGLHHTFFCACIGETRLFSELTFGQNMDRGTKYAFALPAIPTTIDGSVQNLDERSLFVRLEQDVSKWATIGARYDFYSPDTTQKNNGRDTYSFVAVAHFTKGLQLMTEFDHAIDNVHKAGAPPPSKHIDTFSAVLQARF